LLGPGRSMIMDLASAEQADTANAVFTGMQMVGRFLALSLGSVPLEAVLGYECAGTAAGDVIHMQAIMGLSAGLLFLCSLCSLCVSEVPHRPHGASRGGLEGGNARLLEDPVNAGLGDVPRISDAEGERGGGASAAGGGAHEGRGEGGGEGGEIPSLKTMAGVRQHSGMPALLAVQLVGWMALMAQCFYWTEWIGDYQVRLVLSIQGGGGADTGGGGVMRGLAMNVVRGVGAGEWWRCGCCRWKMVCVLPSTKPPLQSRICLHRVGVGGGKKS
jgi:hypothetical protein